MLTRAERRHRRERIIARRKFIAIHIWHLYGPDKQDWGRYAKFNLNCGCTGCGQHYKKYFGWKRKRRVALKTAL